MSKQTSETRLMLDETEMRVGTPDSSDEIPTSKVLKVSKTSSIKKEKNRNKNMEILSRVRNHATKLG